MGQDLNQHIYLRENSRNWQFIIRVPADILKAYGGRKVHTRSTGTADKHAASLKASAWERALEVEWAVMRAALSPVHALTTMSDDAQAQFRAFVLDWRLDLDATERRTGEQRRRDPEGEFRADEWAFIDEAVADADNGKPGELNRLVRMALDRAGLAAHPESEAFSKAREAYISAMDAAESETHRRDNEGFDFRPTAPAQPPKVTSETTSGPSMDDLRKRWEAQEAPEESSRAEARTAVRMLDAETGGLLAPMIEKRHIIAFRESRMATGVDGATVQKQLNLLRPIFRCAKDDGIITANPTDGVKAPKSAKDPDKTRTPFDAADLRKLFGSGLYSTEHDARTDREQAQFWVPLLALWTGARQSELVQLLTADIGTTEGHTFIHITTGAGKRVKTKGSKRRVPVHRELIACGFIGYVNGMRARGAVRLFPGYRFGVIAIPSSLRPC